MKRVPFPYWLKLTISSFCITILVLVVVFYFVFNEIERSTKDDLLNDLNQTEYYIKNQTEKYENYLTDLADGLRRNGQLVKHLRNTVNLGSSDDLFSVDENENDEVDFAKNSETIYSILKGDSQIYEESDVFILINQVGEVVLNKNNIKAWGEDLSAINLFDYSMNETDSPTAWWYGKKWSQYLLPDQYEGLYFVTGVQLNDQQGLYGLILIGKKVDVKYFNQFKIAELSNPPILNYMLEYTLLSSEFEGSAYEQLQTYLHGLEKNGRDLSESQNIEVMLNDEMYIGKLSRVENEDKKFYQQLLIKNFSMPFEKRLSKFKNLFTLLAIAAVIITLLISFYMSHILTTTIHELIKAVSKIGLGDFSARVNISTRDEVAVLGEAFNKMGEDLETGKFIEGAMKKYVSSDVVDDLKENRDLLELGGTKETLSILFSDIESFTSVSESMSPEDLIAWLNNYLSSMSTIIEKDNFGTIDKYVGDAIIAFWNAPKKLENHAIYAAKSALAQRMHLEKSQPMKKGVQASCRIGLHTGDVIVGNVGSESRLNYTAIGDAMNLAARLESANKQYGAKIMISEAFKNALNDQFLCRKLDTIIVKGKSKPVTVYELIADKASATSEQNERVLAFERMLAVYMKRDFNYALELLKGLTENPILIENYTKRCESFILNPPDEMWNGERRLNRK